MRRIVAVVVVIGTLVLLPTGAGARVSGDRTTFPGTNGKIVFVGWNGDDEIFRVDPDGSGLTQLTTNGVSDVSPVWNASGTMIAWIRQGDVWTMRANGTRRRQVTRTVRYEYQVAWAPSGDRLVVVRDMPATYDLFVIDLRGRKVQRLTTGGGNDNDPAWSPDGRWIAYNTDTEGADQVFRIRPDGTASQQLTDLAGSTYVGGWHPGGRRLVIFSNEGGDYDLYRIRRDGSGVTQLTFNAWDDEEPRYSPDGHRLVWISNADGDYEIVTARPSNLAGAAPATDNASRDSSPDWQPRRA